MLKLTAVIYIIMASMVAGSFVIAALSFGRVDGLSIALSAAAGAIVALPFSWMVAKRLDKVIRPAVRSETAATIKE